MRMTLRERRRRQTARDIQMAALTLSLRDGYDHLTTEAIATEAGISTRTFFNYYPNKQAAVLGPALSLPDVPPEWFIDSSRSLTGDIVRLLVEAMLSDPPDRTLLRTILQVIASNPALPDLFGKRLGDMALGLAGLVQRRLGAGTEIEARLLAEVSVQALAHAVSTWARDDTMQMQDVVPLMTAILQRVGQRLGTGADPA